MERVAAFSDRELFLTLERHCLEKLVRTHVVLEVRCVVRLLEELSHRQSKQFLCFLAICHVKWRLQQEVEISQLLDSQQALQNHIEVVCVDQVVETHETWLV